MAISLNSLILENKDLSSIVETSDTFNESYISSVFTYLTEMYNEYREADKEFYRSLYEANSMVAINESFADFFGKIKDVLHKFLKYIKSLFDRFNTTLHRMIGSDKYLLKNEETLNKFNTDCEFEYDGYTFTIDEITPKLETYSNFDNLLEIDWSAIKKNDDKNNKKQIKQTLDELKSSLDSDYYDKVRAGVLGLNDPIRESDYTDELFKLYRDGDTNSHIFTVTSSVVRSSYTGLKDYKNIENNVKNKKKEIEDKYKKIQDRVDKAAKFTLKDGRYQVSISGHGDDLDLDNESMQQLNLYIKLVTEQVIKMTTIHSLAFSYKLDALKDKMMQDKKILYIAMNKVLKDKNIRNGEINNGV